MDYDAVFLWKRHLRPVGPIFKGQEGTAPALRRPAYIVTQRHNADESIGAWS